MSWLFVQNEYVAISGNFHSAENVRCPQCRIVLSRQEKAMCSCIQCGSRFVLVSESEYQKYKNTAPTDKVWTIPGSQSGVTHTVTFKSGAWACTCQSFRIRKTDCKHVRAKRGY